MGDLHRGYEATVCVRGPTSRERKPYIQDLIPKKKISWTAS